MNISPVTPLPADWSATSRLAVTAVTTVLRNGRRWGEVHELPTEGRAVGYRRLPDGSEEAGTFTGLNAKDDAWRWVLRSPLSWDLIWNLQDQVALEVAR